MNIWAGSFGDDYVQRNPATPEAIDAREKLWRIIFNAMLPAAPKSVLEVGANIGINLRALRKIKSDIRRVATEPNELAQRQLIAERAVDQIVGDLSAYDQQVDLAFTSGVLIHIPPDELFSMCANIQRIATRWIVAIEYFSHEPQEVMYRGEMGRLWKRDFGAFYLDNFPDLHPIGCGFAWERLTGLQNLTWHLLEKR